MADEDVLDTQDVRGPVTDELEPFSEEVPVGAFLFGIDVARRKDAQPKKVREQERAPFVVDLPQAFILFDGRRVGKMHHITLGP